MPCATTTIRPTTEPTRYAIPSTQACITEDALGNPRVDGNNNRNSGAVQLSESPHLSVAGVGDGTVDLIWTKPTDLTGTITGYNLYYGEVGGAFIDPPIMITDPDTLTYQVTGLTNGTEYQFLVVSVVDGEQSQFASNLVTATPLSPPIGVNRRPTDSQLASSKENQPRYWEKLGFGDCVKEELDDSFGSVWELFSPASVLILKSARVNDVWLRPGAGQYGTVSAKDISHAIVCVATD